MAVAFQQVFEAASHRYSPEAWRMLSQTEQACVIYQEMRRMDAQAAWQEMDAEAVWQEEA